ncbi:MAG TPA: TolC family protein, partial [Candidatus Dormibacteraeota bacterium]|nr:TolC family protein [Candidatus Dormibacteraeota bacterium]
MSARSPRLRVTLRQHPLAILAALLLSLACPKPGCAADAGDTARSALLDALPGAAQAANAAAPDAPVQTLTLAQAHELALKNHPTLAAAEYRALAATEVFKQARAGLLPQVNLYGSAVHADSANTRILAGGLNNPNVMSRAAYGAGLSQLITDFGRTSNLAASSRLQASAEEYSAQATREQVLLEVDRGYFAVLQAQAVENVARQTVDTRQLLLERVSILAQNKLKSDLDVSFARVAREDARLLQQKAQNDFDSSMAALATALGLRESQHFSLVEAAPAAPAASDVAVLIERALRQRPELGSLRDARDAALHLARSLRDSRLPTLSAVIAAGDAPAHDARLPGSYSAGGIQLTMPVFAGGLYEARQHEAELRAKAAAESLRSLEDQVSRDVRIEWL